MCRVVITAFLRAGVQCASIACCNFVWKHTSACCCLADVQTKYFYFQEEDEEDVQGILYNEMYNLELESGKWHEVILRYSCVVQHRQPDNLGQRVKLDALNLVVAENDQVGHENWTLCTRVS